jgi:predicted MFS family arabinose efflux permease
MSCTTYIGVSLGAAVMGPIFDGPGFGVVGAISATAALLGVAVFRIRRVEDAPEPVTAMEPGP